MTRRLTRDFQKPWTVVDISNSLLQATNSYLFGFLVNSHIKYVGPVTGWTMRPKCILNQWGRVTHIIELCYHWFSNVLSPVRSHYLNQCWRIANCTIRNKFKFLLYNHAFSLKKKVLMTKSSAKWQPSCLGAKWDVVLSCLPIAP